MPCEDGHHRFMPGDDPDDLWECVDCHAFYEPEGDWPDKTEPWEPEMFERPKPHKPKGKR